MTYRDHVAIALRSGPPAVLARASHPGPTVAVTILTALLAGVFGVGPGRGTAVTLAVLAGQLTIGWSNDLVDAERDRRSGRTDKPVAEGELAEGLLRRAIGIAVVACVGLSLACGWRSATVHLAARSRLRVGLQPRPQADPLVCRPVCRRLRCAARHRLPRGGGPGVAAGAG